MIRRNSILFLLLFISSLSGYSQSLPYACAGDMESYGVPGLSNSVFFWEIDGGEVLEGQGNDTVVIRWNYDRRSHTISVTEQSQFGCFGIPVEAELDIDAPLADITDDAEVCEGDFFEFDAETTYDYALTYLWSDNSTNSTFVSSEEGYVWVRVTGEDGCSDYDSTYLTVHPLPDINLGRDTSLCGSETWYINAGDFASYQWSTGDIINPLLVDGMRTEPEAVWVEVTDFNGCVNSDTLLLEVCDVYALFASIPNTITPGDLNGQNDEWIIPNIEMFPDAVLEIYDRWGRLVYRSNDIYNNPWRGETMAGEELPMDAYYYVLDIHVSHTEPLTGYINIIR